MPFRSRWALDANRRPDDAEWNVTELWDFGLPVDIAAPPEHLIRPPGRFGGTMSEVRATRKTAGS